MTMEIYLPAGFANVRYTYDGVGLLNAMGTSCGVATLEDDPNVIAEACADLWDDGIQQSGARLANSYTYTGTQVTLGNDGGPLQLGVATRSVPGSQGSSCLPPNVSKLLRKRTEFAGRKYRGRMYLPAGFLFETEVTDAGNISAGVISGENVQLDGLVAGYALAGYPLHLLHQHGTYVNSEGATVSVAPIAPTPLVALTADPLVSTQRRRLR